MGITSPTDENLGILREEGRLKPVREYVAGTDPVLKLSLTANAVYLITVAE